MIGLFGASDTTRLSFTYNGLTFNDGTEGDTFEVNNVVPLTSYDFVQEVNQFRDGLEAYAMRKVARTIRVEGVIRAASQKALFDKMQALAAACDPALISHDNPGADFLALDFTTPSVAGDVSSRYYARPLKVPEPIISEFNGTAAMFSIDFLLKDPRRYEQSQTTLEGDGTATDGGDYPTWPTLTLTMTDTGTTTVTIACTNAVHGAQSLVIDVTGLTVGQVVTIDMEGRSIDVDGTATPSIYSSGTYFHLDPGSNTIAYTGDANVTGELAWRDAFCL